MPYRSDRSADIRAASIDDPLKLDRQFALDLLGITISATRMKCDRRSGCTYVSNARPV